MARSWKQIVLAICSWLLLTVQPRAATLPSAGVFPAPPSTGLVFYADPRVSESLWPLLFQMIEEDLAAQGDGVLDKRPAIFRGSEDLRNIALPSMVTVKLLGRCDLLPQASLRSDSGPLGWVHRAAGRIQPFIFIDCGRLARVLQAAAMRMSKEQRQHAMAQAISRVMIHEWIHIATQQAVHSKRGLAQPSLSVDELIAPANQHPFSASRR